MYATHFTPAPPIQHHQPIISLTGPPLDHHHQPSPQQQRRLLPAFVQDFSPSPSSCFHSAAMQC